MREIDSGHDVQLEDPAGIVRVLEDLAEVLSTTLRVQ